MHSDVHAYAVGRPMYNMYISKYAAGLIMHIAEYVHKYVSHYAYFAPQVVGSLLLDGELHSIFIPEVVVTPEPLVLKSLY